MSDRDESTGPHVAAQVAASWSVFDAAARERRLGDALKACALALEGAQGEMRRVLEFVGAPERILGNPTTKHGEIAEQVHVGVTRACQRLHRQSPTATFDGVPRLGEVDYRVDGLDIQSKYSNGLKNTLDHVLEHAEKYTRFSSGDGVYHIPRDQFEQMSELRATGLINGMSEGSADTVDRKLAALQGTSGRTIDDLVRPGNATYSEVQQGKIHETVKLREQGLQEKSEALKDKARADHSPSIEGAASAAAMGAAAGSGVRLGHAVWVKWREGKNIFRGDFTPDDWVDIGVATGKGATSGAVAGASLYLITNSTDLAAPLAGSVVSGLMGIGELLQRYGRQEIDAEQFVELSQMVALDSALVGLASVAGQALIPVPMLGAFVGSLAGKIVASALKGSLASSSAEIQQRLQEYEVQARRELDAQSAALLDHLDVYFGTLAGLMRLAFSEEANTRLRLDASVAIAEHMGVPEENILRATDALDTFMTE